MNPFLPSFLAGAAAIGVPTMLLNLRRRKAERAALSSGAALWICGKARYLVDGHELGVLRIKQAEDSRARLCAAPLREQLVRYQFKRALPVIRCPFCEGKSLGDDEKRCACQGTGKWPVRA